MKEVTRMRLSKQALNANGVTKEQYLDWCRRNKKRSSNALTREEFFTKLTFGKLIIDKDGKVVKSTK